MKTFVTILGLISFQAILEVSHAKSIKAGQYRIKINSELNPYTVISTMNTSKHIHNKP
jgi:hypothetical protein